MGFKKIISIHGVPRSGTSWLGQIIDSSPDVNYKYQPLFSYAFKNEIDLNSTKNQIVKYFTRLYNYKDNFLDQLYKKNQGIYPNFEQKEKLAKVLATKMVRYHYLIPKLIKELDNIKCIFIVRHPCGVLNSWKNTPREFNKNWDFEEEWRFAQSMNEFRPEQYFGFNKWKEASKLFLTMGEKYPKQVKIIRYEDLVQNPMGITKEIYKFAELKVTEQTLDFITESTSAHQSDPSSVYKGHKDIYDWQKNLDSKIIEKIEEELMGTDLQRFIKE